MTFLKKLSLILNFFFFLFWPPHNISNFCISEKIRVVVVTYATAVATPDPLIHWARLEMEPVFWHYRDMLPHCATVGTPIYLFF